MAFYEQMNRQNGRKKANRNIAESEESGQYRQPGEDRQHAGRKFSRKNEADAEQRSRTYGKTQRTVRDPSFRNNPDREQRFRTADDRRQSSRTESFQNRDHNKYSFRSDDRRNNRDHQPERRNQDGWNHQDRHFSDDRQRTRREFSSKDRTAQERDIPQPDYLDFEYRQDRSDEQLADVTPEANQILIGRNPIREALKQHRDFEKLLVQKGELSGSAREIVAQAKEQKIMVQVVDKSRLDAIASSHQGLIGITSAYSYATVEEILDLAKERGEDPFLILLDSVTDPHNLGAIIRTAECVGAHGVVVPLHRSVGLTPAAVKASAGAIEHIKVARVTNLNRTIEELQKRNIWVYAVTMNGTDYESVSFQGGTALVIGAEGEGIGRLTEEKCDQSVSLPLRGHLDSLNASVAAGIMMYQVLSCRRRNGK